MSFTRRCRAAGAVVLAAVATLACGGPEGARAPDDDRGGADGGARSACELLTSAEMAELAGEPVQARPGKSGPKHSECEYWGTTNEVPYLSVTAYWSGGRDAWETYRTGMGIAGDLVRAAEGVELDSITKPGPVSGLGDAAVYSELVPAAVLRGDQFLELHLFYLPDAKRKFRGLVERMLARL
jgi:hypothetical protein